MYRFYTLGLGLTPLDRVKHTHTHFENSIMFGLAISCIHSRFSHLRKTRIGSLDRVRRGGYFWFSSSCASGLIGTFFPFLYIILYFFRIDEASLYESDACLLASIGWLCPFLWRSGNMFSRYKRHVSLERNDWVGYFSWPRHWVASK
jgi:hypothetical protein